MLITEFVDNLTDYLENIFKNYQGLSYKNSPDPDSGSNTSKPFIYQYLIPSSELVEYYPARSPVIVIVLDEIADRDTYSLSIHTCIRHDSISEKEKVEPVEGSENLYTYKTDDGYTTSSDVELYKSSLLFISFIHNAILNYTDQTLTDIAVELPDASNSEFPFSTANVSFKVKLNPFMIAQNPYVDNY